MNAIWSTNDTGVARRLRAISTHPVGHGRTEEEAIADLKEQLADREP